MTSQELQRNLSIVKTEKTSQNQDLQNTAEYLV